MSSIHDLRYQKLIENLIKIRESQGVTQVQLSAALKRPQSYIAKVENLDRRIDIIELLDWLAVLETNIIDLLRKSDLTS